MECACDKSEPEYKRCDCPNRWQLKSAADIESLADRLSGKKVRERFLNGHQYELWEFACARRAKGFIATLRALGAFNRLLNDSCRMWLSSNVEIYYRNNDKTDKLNPLED